MKTLFAGFPLLAACAAAGVYAATLIDLKVVDRCPGQVLETWRHRGQLHVSAFPATVMRRTLPTAPAGGCWACCRSMASMW